MEKIYNRAKDKDVAAVKLYAADDEEHLSYDSAGKELLSAAEVKDLFVQGMVIEMKGDLYQPLCLVADNTAVKVLVAKEATNTLTAYNFYSKEKHLGK